MNDIDMAKTKFVRVYGNGDEVVFYSDSGGAAVTSCVSVDLPQGQTMDCYRVEDNGERGPLIARFVGEGGGPLCVWLVWDQ